MYKCECGREFDSKVKRAGHYGHCAVHLGEDRYKKNLDIFSKHASENLKATNYKKKLEREEKKKSDLDIWISEEHPCLVCGKIMTEYYGRGDYCCELCARKASHLNMSEESRKSYEEGIRKGLETQKKMREEGLIHNSFGNLTDEQRKKGHEKSIESRSRNSKNNRKEWLEKVLSNELQAWQGGFSKLKWALIEFGYKEYKCDCCGLSEWYGQPIPLEVHHVDGDSHNNDINNIKFLCRICHTKTPDYSWKSYNKRRRKEV